VNFQLQQGCDGKVTVCIRAAARYDREAVEFGELRTSGNQHDEQHTHGD
jgi:hypothetical protein